MTSISRDEPRRFIFISLSVIMAALLVYFALSSIPAALRPTESPSVNPVPSASSTR